MEEHNGTASSYERPHDGLITLVAASAHANLTGKLNENGPLTSPPYWQTRQRRDSTLSDVSNKRLSGLIRLKDNSEEESEEFRACWAKSAKIDDYVIVSGSTPKAGLGSYVVWNCTVVTLYVGFIPTICVNGLTGLMRTYRADHSRYANDILNSTS